MLAVIDTNIWVSAMLRPSGYASELIEALADHQFIALTSNSLLEELRDVIQRPRLSERFGLTEETRSRVLSILYDRSIRIPDPVVTAVGRDPKDDVFLAVAVAGGADALVTRDDDLKRDPAVLAYAAVAGVRIMTIQQCLDALAEERSS